MATYMANVLAAILCTILMLNVRVVSVVRDSAESHAKFCKATRVALLGGAVEE